MILFIISALVISTLAREELNCDFPKKFELVVKGGNKLEIDDVELKLSLARDTLNVFTHPTTNRVNFVIKETVVDFKGSLDTDGWGFSASIDQTIHTQTLGVAILEDSVEGSQLKKCQTFLPRNSSERANFRYEVEDEILRLAAKCINMNLSDKLGSLDSHDFASFEDTFDFGPLSVDPLHQSQTLCAVSPPASEIKEKFSASQSTLDAIVDVAIIEIVTGIKTTDSIKIQLPNITDSVMLPGFLSLMGTANFTAFDGYLSDFTTARRTSDIILDRDGNKFSIAFGLGLIDPTFKYNFTAKKLIVECNSNLTANLRDLVFEVKVAVDYSQNSCNTTLEHLQITRAQELILHLNRTDMGACSVAANNVIEEWQSNILQKSDGIVRGFILNLLKKFDCSKYRPSDISIVDHDLNISVINVKRLVRSLKNEILYNILQSRKL